jgi:hypothetical protein
MGILSRPATRRRAGNAIDQHLENVVKQLRRF